MSDERQLTPMGQSIQRKKEKLNACKNLFVSDPCNDYLEGQIRVLSEEIESDQKLLPAEQEMVEEAHLAGQAYAVGSHKDFKQIHSNEKEYFQTKYRQK